MVATTFLDYDQELNEEQKQVVFSKGGPTLVIAGAGSGKTRTITYRVARLIEEGVSPRSIFLATFTNKAAREMLHRVECLLGMSIQEVWGGTFHHLCNLILRREARAVGYDHSYTILDREDQKEVLELCLEDLKIDRKNRRFPKADLLVNVFSLSRNTLLSIEDIVAKHCPQFMEWTSHISHLSALYQERKRQTNVMDFDDLLWYVWWLLREDQGVRKKYGNMFHHILVDEYQDTNRIQAEIVDFLAEVHRNLLVVGDDAQSIYAFRGAHFANILEFPKRYPDCTVYKLETNYRSTAAILDLANAVIAHNKYQFPKVLRPVRGKGNKPVVIAVQNVSEQAQYVASLVLELRHEGYRLEDMAVLYRAHYQSMEIQVEFTRRGIPFMVRSGIRFFEQAHIKDVVAYLKLIVNPLDELAWKRVLRLYPGIGKATAERIWQVVKESPDPLGAVEREEVRALLPVHGEESFQALVNTLFRLEELALSPASAIQMILERGYAEYVERHYADYRDRLQDVEELARFATRYSSIEDFLSELALLGEVEAERIVEGALPDEKIVLSTVHQAKGLEWGCVFVVWLCEGGFPLAQSINRPEDVEEERRLFYVACTRAKDFLFLSYPLFTETSSARTTLRRPSRFLREISPSYYTKHFLRDVR